MQRLITNWCAGFFLATLFTGSACAQRAFTWPEIRDRFQAGNPSLRAGQIATDESRASEITAYLRPNPNLSLLGDQVNPFNGGPPHSTFGTLLSVASISYLHERRHKRELRRESAEDATKIAVSGQQDLERTLLFTLRMAFVQTLQEKAIRDLARENLAYYDHLLDLNRERYKAGAISRVDLDRLELQRVTYESDLQTAEVNLRTAKIQLLTLLDDRTPVEQFDVTGLYDFSAIVMSLDEVRQVALDTRPDLRAALESVEKAKVDHRLATANGSTDPTLGFDVGRNPPIDQYFGVTLSFPLRIFDRNQGEKRRTQLDIGRNEKLVQAARAQVFSDVDSAYATLSGTLVLLQPYRDRYLQQATGVRDTISFSYQNGGASLLDFLSAQADYRAIKVAYLNLVASYLNAANQLNEAVGREVIP
jgi:cobalt-zinc-cadmium efflux system outer membrane protein